MPASPGPFNILDFGAVPDGRTRCTAAIRRAIECCKAAGGGTVLVPAGRFLTGPIVLASDITLHVDAGAHVLFSTDLDDYPTVLQHRGGGHCHGFSPCVFAENASNVAVVGRGILDGQGRPWWKLVMDRIENRPVDPAVRARIDAFQRADREMNLPGGTGGFNRPILLQFVACTNVLVQGVTLTNSPTWTLHPLFCENVTVHAITLINPFDAPNTDGVNPDSCRNVRISDCLIDTGDDCVTLKSGVGRGDHRPCENIAVTNCSMVHGHGGVVIGSEMSGGVRNVVVSNCIFDETYRGVRIKSRRGRGGAVEDIRVSNIIMRRVVCPLVINLFYSCGGEPDDPYLYGTDAKPVDERTPTVRRIHLSGITATDFRGAAAFICGLPERPVEGVTFSDMRMTADPEETEGGCPACFHGMDNMIGRGFNCTHLADAVFRNVHVSALDGPAFNFDAVSEVDVLGLRTAVADPNVPAVRLGDSASVVVRGCRRPAGTDTFCRITGARTKALQLCDNHFPDGAVEIDRDLDPEAVVVR
ncbi:MAG: endopolygalacturonase [Phycisphaeraceae bacterium]|nr:endopolygalacturonase [Phycisphaeraceae bacterium]